MSTSKLQKHAINEFKQTFSNLTIIENIRPQWMINEQGERLELDIWIKELDVAIEIQGQQHDRFTPGFHETHNDFIAQVNRDNSKKQMCEKLGIRLYEARTINDVNDLLTIVKNLAEEKKLYRRITKSLPSLVACYSPSDFDINNLKFEYQKRMTIIANRIFEELPNSKMQDKPLAQMLKRIKYCVHDQKRRTEHKVNLLKAYASLVKSCALHNKADTDELKLKYREKIVKTETIINGLAKKIYPAYKKR